MQRGLGGNPHSLLHQDNQSTYLPLCKKPTLVRIGRWGDREIGRWGNSRPTFVLVNLTQI
ncbi:hypothetical protein [Moorena sp. SIO4G3]|uniref:hypothetical protein n=1 Tax=Moorena sp. SIO4G3 TaxID=2607821 RepID=UPI00142B8175|nr:hypothetical protein [Moorena sp. SIO4G3]NEO79887.1 hypothetical protein [Moorena sp. SIO4G3]